VDTGFSGASASRPRAWTGSSGTPSVGGSKACWSGSWTDGAAARPIAYAQFQDLVALGIRFLSPNESIDTGTESPMSRSLLHLFAAFAEMEREIIRDRVRAGVRAAKARRSLSRASPAGLPTRRRAPYARRGPKSAVTNAVAIGPSASGVAGWPAGAYPAPRHLRRGSQGGVRDPSGHPASRPWRFAGPD
jgi:hypothetical protein